MQSKKLPKRILVTTHGTALSGAEIALVRIVRLLDKDKFKVIVVLPSKEGVIYNEFSAIPEVKVLIVDGDPTLIGMKKTSVVKSAINNPRTLLSLLKMIRDYCRIVKRKGVDLILTSSIKTDYIGSLVGFFSKTPVMWYVHDYVDNHYFPRGVIKSFVLFGNLFPKIVICISNAVRMALIEAGIQEKKLRTIYSPSPQNIFQKPNHFGNDIRCELGLPPETRLVTMVGRIAYPKGQLEFVQAAALMLTQVENVVFLVVGDSVFGAQDEAYKRRVELAVSQLPDLVRVRLLGMRQDAMQIMVKSDVVVFNSLWPEGFALAVAEAMELGIPVVSTALGGTAEMVEDQVTGLKIEPGDVAGLSKAIGWILAHPKEASMMARAGQQRIRQILSIENVRRLEDLMSE